MPVAVPWPAWGVLETRGSLDAMPNVIGGLGADLQMLGNVSEPVASRTRWPEAKKLNGPGWLCPGPQAEQTWGIDPYSLHSSNYSLYK